MLGDRRAKALFVFTLAMGTGVALPAPSAAETLREVLEAVYRTNPNIHAERNRLQAISEADNQAWAGALPQVSASTTYSNVDQDQVVNTEIFGMATQSTRHYKLDSFSYTLSAEQTLFNGFRNYHAIKQAKSRVRAGEAQLTAYEQQVLRDAATAYFDVVRDMKVYSANSSNVDVLMNQLKDVKVRFELGAVTKTDVSQAEARFAGARSQLAEAKTALMVSRARFRELAGFLPGTLDPTPPLPLLPANEEEALAFASANAPLATAIREEEAASRRQYYIERSALAPSVAFTASYLNADEASSFVDHDEQFAYGVRATVPIFLGGLRFSKIREAKAMNERDRSRIVAVDRQIETQVTAAWEQLFEARSRIDAAQAQADANELALVGVKREAQLGTRSTLDVLNAEQEYLNSTVMLASANRDEQVAAYSLLAAIGGLTIDADAYEPQAAGPALPEDLDYGDGPPPELTAAEENE